jgi:two-component system response regulator YesN
VNLLIADDEMVIRRGLLSLDWNSIGIDEVMCASNGDEARQLLLSTSIDLMISDIRMPGCSGIELAALIKEHSMDTAVVLLTSFSEFDYARSALKSGVYDYLLKPVAPSELLKSVQTVKNRLVHKRQQEDVLKSLKNIKDDGSTVIQVQNKFTDTTPEILSMLLDLAEEYSEQLSLGKLAEKYHFTSGYLSKRIKKETGYSFNELLNSMRLMNAANLLKKGMRVSEVCEGCGFHDTHYFSQLFKRCFQMSPKEYKNQSILEEVKLQDVLNRMEKKD